MPIGTPILREVKTLRLDLYRSKVLHWRHRASKSLCLIYPRGMETSKENDSWRLAASTVKRGPQNQGGSSINATKYAAPIGSRDSEDTTYLKK